MQQQLRRQFQHEHIPHYDSHDPSSSQLPQSAPQAAIVTLYSHQESADLQLRLRKPLPWKQDVELMIQTPGCTRTLKDEGRRILFGASSTRKSLPPSYCSSRWAEAHLRAGWAARLGIGCVYRGMHILTSGDICLVCSWSLPRTVETWQTLEVSFIPQRSLLLHQGSMLDRKH